MQYLNKHQLAFLLDIKVEDARAKMCAAWAKHKGIPEEYDKAGSRVGKTARDEKKKVKDPFPPAMEIAVLSKFGGLPDLQFACDDIEKNYLKRPGTRKYILSDYPDKELTKQHAAGKPYKLHIPSFISAFLSREDQDTIVSEWERRYPQAFKKYETDRMTFLLIVEKNDVAVVTKSYSTASLCCEAFKKAEDYYYSIREMVRLVMKDEFGRTIYWDYVFPI